MLTGKLNGPNEVHPQRTRRDRARALLLECRNGLSHLAFFQKFLNFLSRIQVSSVTAKSKFKELKLHKPNAEKAKLVRGAVCLFIAIVLGWVSLQSSEEKGRLLFARSHWPHLQAWNETLTSFHLKHQLQLGNFTALLKTLPEAFSDSSDIWANENGCYVYLSKSPFDQSTSTEFWTCASNSPPLRWVNLGSGVEGFDRLIEFLNKNKAKEPKIAAKKVMIRRNLIDPKEIRY